ncbi:endolytic transglycosylase MltG [Micromonospora aurantiaca]|uniref:Endolytic murein transglycosylase n=1 Tax=Micromonospora aurantiaca (nom. illeg.) TaxID=47850 RepID=A0A1C6SMD1_9ACTN|nr:MULTISPECIES: endolytic transglycosylase MltG [Micromonospora]ADL45864.1 aminodeoxychorismate lyase [Micromonospora aurantiaca ATCC 27029]ADU07954.1 aminodeoxychorismate lyase [Micromonospora sp. L5]AXH91915.1 endolytic transglycosylase MltG [Micromonospora aurantiaca]KAB1107990.1 endolytic transglycosylase MltG [Micromonospora aurantiaca]MBC9002899.1 endolytic transglycosylase MltG [Micromonospora aurantiaca]
MIDDLDLGFDEPDRGEKGRHRRGAVRRRQGKSGGGRGKTLLALALALVLLGGIGGGAFYGFDRVQNYFVTPDYDGSGTGEVTVEIKQGALIADMADALVAADVVKSTKAFIEAAEENSRSKNIQPGTYKMRKQMSGDAAVVALLDLKNKIVNGITIPEGLTAKTVYKRLSEKTDIPVKDFEAAAKDPEALGVPDWWFKRSDGKKVNPSIEGFLFPDTYEIPPKATAETVLKLMVDNFLTVTSGMQYAEKVQKDRGGITPYEALIVASLAQAEAGNKADLGKVARVAYNRVYGEFPCNCLEMDVTVNYYLELTGQKTKASKDMTAAELDNPKNPYNRKLRGLVPSPINNPGKEALEGALSPPDGKWLYFVAISRDGRSAFAETYAEQKRNEQKAREAGII